MAAIAEAVIWIRQRLLCPSLVHVPPSPEVDPADKICGRYRYAISRREGGVDLVL